MEFSEVTTQNALLLLVSEENKVGGVLEEEEEISGVLVDGPLGVSHKADIDGLC